MRPLLRCCFSAGSLIFHFISLTGLGMGWLFYREISESLRIASVGAATTAQVQSVEDETFSDSGSVQILIHYFAPPPDGDANDLSPGPMRFATLNLADHDDPCPPDGGSVCLAPGDEVRVLYDPADPERVIFHATRASILTRPKNLLGILFAALLLIGGYGLLLLRCLTQADDGNRRSPPPPD